MGNARLNKISDEPRVESKSELVFINRSAILYKLVRLDDFLDKCT